MKPHIIIVYLIVANLLLGCMPPPPPAISDIRESMVKVRAIRVNFIEYEIDMNAVIKEAERGCGIYDRVPTLVSDRCVDFDYASHVCKEKEFLFICS